MAADWLASLPSEDAGAPESPGSPAEGDAAPPAAAEEADPAPSPDDTAAAWLADLGFDAEEARAALEKASGDADEALLLLRARTAEPAAGKRRRPSDSDDECVELEGFRCRVRRRLLVLRLRSHDADGPVVGRVKADGSFTFHGVDEWAQELYDAAPLRPGADGCAAFDAAAAAAALGSGAPYACASFASAEEVRGAHAELEGLRADGSLSGAASRTTADVKARSDLVAFLDLRDGTPKCPPCCLRLFRRLEAAACAAGWPSSGQLLCPRLGMAAVYDGRGARYAAHRDNELVVRGRADGPAAQHGRRWMNHRVLTAIVYVNPEGFDCPEDGGQLRCHVGAEAGDHLGTTATRTEDVSPRGGTAVLFPSRAVLHEVMPSYRRRYALTLWLVTAPGEDGAGVSLRP